MTTHSGMDRITLHVGDRAVRLDDGLLALGSTAAEFDVVDWGQDVVALRAVDTGRYVGADDTGALVADRDGPGGWVVRETFRLHHRPDGTALLHHLASGRHVGVTPDGRLSVATGDPAVFTVTLLVDGAAARRAAAGADVAVVVLGNHPMVNGRETEDRADLALPTGQAELLRAVHAANPRTVLALTSSYPYAVGWAQSTPAVLWSAHGGQEHGNGLADVLLGAADPGGRLTQTWYADAAELPDLLDYDVIGADATYLYHRGEPLYPFGHGLSYATFDYADLRLSTTTARAGEEVEVSVEVTNTGRRPGTEVVQLYTRQRRSRAGQPLRQLRDFARVTLDPSCAAG
ncbi:glycoside hydrolase family 3 C-terminal domain-containing protein [Micromonospora sp. BRA006-A]|nr:glycoside hydrolase family 3 C-terminal domain-containing protein [Micromonospora sp. BRA006-A]